MQHELRVPRGRWHKCGVQKCVALCVLCSYVCLYVCVCVCVCCPRNCAGVPAVVTGDAARVLQAARVAQLTADKAARADAKRERRAARKAAAAVAAESEAPPGPAKPGSAQPAHVA